MNTTAGPMTGSCGWCGNYHTGVCWLVKAIEYHPNGGVKRVEFRDPQPLAVPTIPFGPQKIDGNTWNISTTHLEPLA